MHRRSASRVCILAVPPSSSPSQAYISRAFTINTTFLSTQMLDWQAWKLLPKGSINPCVLASSSSISMVCPHVRGPWLTIQEPSALGSLPSPSSAFYPTKHCPMPNISLSSSWFWISWVSLLSSSRAVSKKKVSCMNIHVHIPTQSTYHSDMLMNSNFFLLKKMCTHTISGRILAPKKDFLQFS